MEGREGKKGEGRKKGGGKEKRRQEVHASNVGQRESTL